MKPSVTVGLVLMVPARLWYLCYGWLLYQTITSETNPWIKALFAATFILWLLTIAGLVFFVVMFWREKDHVSNCGNPNLYCPDEIMIQLGWILLPSDHGYVTISL